MKIENPKGAAAAVADANELNEQLEAAVAEREQLATDKAGLEESLTALTGENTQLKEELQTVKDELTAAELKASGNEALAGEKETAVTELQTKFDELEALKNELEKNLDVRTQELADTSAEVERLKTVLEGKEQEVEDANKLADEAAAEADEVAAQNALIADKLKVKGGKPDTTTGDELAGDKESAGIIEKYKQLQKNVKNARSRQEKVENQRALNRLQNDPDAKGVIAAYLNTEYSTTSVEIPKFKANDADTEVYNTYKELTNARASIMGDKSFTLAERREEQRRLQNKINEMLRDSEQSAAISRCQKELYR